MSRRSFFFAGGGTGGHIYPSIAVAEQIVKLEPQSHIHFFVSTREIDTEILTQTNFSYTKLPAKGFSARPDRLIDFAVSFLKSCHIAKRAIAESSNAVVIGAGGFVAAPVCWAAHRLKVPVALLNVDILPGRANKMMAGWADAIFVQFDQTTQYFAKSGPKAHVVGCPLRSGFANPQPDRAVQQLGLHKDKKVLLITGASSGAENINRTICSLLEKLSTFADKWQIVHLTGRANFEDVKSKYTAARIKHKVLGYYDDMADLLAAADLVVSRSGAVSVAEYKAAGTPSICMPYPYHKDRHQYLNADKLVEAGAAVVVDDLPDADERAEWLWQELQELIKDEDRRRQMKKACATVTKPDAAPRVAEQLLAIQNQA
ncbi:MAG: UDP-N-acetylglucosamine--N-acetylmuramyl-(pentapeptide) pyrophosphoryl-undecaprenol N-acetylglucosamine transferase [Planctomycetota bacterium]|nr:MAG: UDP-N-acetylglucosamine--N-acetylmuramyl-(pentapeptide) pyrophosphoryl-undecaprenol N-acetylglucosamine transferase [Planctomycetota bacterium]